MPRRIASLIHNGINYIQSPAWIADPRIRADLTTSLLVAEHVVAKAKDHSNLLRAWLVAENVRWQLYFDNSGLTGYSRVLWLECFVGPAVVERPNPLRHQGRRGRRN